MKLIGALSFFAFLFAMEANSQQNITCEDRAQKLKFVVSPSEQGKVLNQVEGVSYRVERNEDDTLSATVKLHGSFRMKINNSHVEFASPYSVTSTGSNKSLSMKVSSNFWPLIINNVPIVDLVCR
jgi:hypothetical protein